jgi:hypothetical protein
MDTIINAALKLFIFINLEKINMLHHYKVLCMIQPLMKIGSHQLKY